MVASHYLTPYNIVSPDINEPKYYSWGLKLNKGSLELMSRNHMLSAQKILKISMIYGFGVLWYIAQVNIYMA